MLRRASTPEPIGGPKTDDEVGASKIVAGLRQRDYVDVSPSPSDGREKILTLAPLAIDCLAALHAAAHEIEERVGQDIDAKSYRQVPLLRCRGWRGRDPCTAPRGPTPRLTRTPRRLGRSAAGSCFEARRSYLLALAIAGPSR
jgi:hypothetical protein